MTFSCALLLIRHGRSSAQPSKLNSTLDVPTIPDALTPLVPAALADPATPTHAAAVADIQLLLEQSASAMADVGVVSAEAKLIPASDALATQPRHTLRGATDVITGACR